MAVVAEVIGVMIEAAAAAAAVALGTIGTADGKLLSAVRLMVVGSGWTKGWRTWSAWCWRSRLQWWL